MRKSRWRMKGGEELWMRECGAGGSLYAEVQDDELGLKGVEIRPDEQWQITVHQCIGGGEAGRGLESNTSMQQAGWRWEDDAFGFHTHSTKYSVYSVPRSHNFLLLGGKK